MSSPVTRDRISLQAQADDWTGAIRASADLLLREGCITENYVDAIFASFEKNGDYMIVVPGVVLSHARPEHGALVTSMSLLTLSAPVPFTPSPGKDISVVFTLAARDSNEHLNVMRTLAEVLVDDDALAELTTTTDVERVLALLGGDQP